MPKENKFFTRLQETAIVRAIQNAEHSTSGEIRVHIENTCKIDPLDRAAHLFKTLKMHKTEHRNGVLIYLAMKDKKFAILGDAGINAIIPDDFWNDIKDFFKNEFKKGRFTEGLCDAIYMAGEHLKENFPHLENDKNELPDEISYGNN